MLAGFSPVHMLLVSSSISDFVRIGFPCVLLDNSVKEISPWVCGHVLGEGGINSYGVMLFTDNLTRGIEL